MESLGSSIDKVFEEANSDIIMNLEIQKINKKIIDACGCTKSFYNITPKIQQIERENKKRNGMIQKASWLQRCFA